ncbi:MAG: HAMP domain-containing protein [Gammaproteobacteria bacterium]|nr:HAMP domain-containing protein [Gammaproteobacteria bacterium]MBT4861219.1 HAMP domain-containing protein [Gammaproteobacteria bacterium]MBT6454030.1 HAMP domain-containing protein [Gammaproteobacteria bacterium]MBT6702958.1 HAMP domain-containing protein [Gammaproteobacteria bacterium]MBT7046659.1 HAMP domain-containing protein [Gammaproteobacteria bacterium]
MFNKHELLISSSTEKLDDSTSLLPYLYFLETSLNKELGIKIQIKQTLGKDEQDWFWVDIPISDITVRFGFPRSRIGVNPPIAFFLLLTIGIFLTIVTAALLTQRLTIPIDRLYQAAQAMGKGHWPEPIKVDGPEELAVLTREFNRMNIQVKELLSNRTTLLAGIAHDLRTPLTQIQLALAMLPDEGGDAELMSSIHDDLNVINRLIGETLSISMELEEEQDAPTDIGKEIEKLISTIQTNGIEIKWSKTETPCQVLHPLALRRILTNFLVNAIRYGDKKPVTISYQCDDKNIIIQILDEGPGIPVEQSEAVFRPFYRLEKSRGSGTGGSGLGLAIVKQLADANKWAALLKPRNGGGTIAELVIPVKVKN